jgi:hypothetical protein
VAEEKDNMNGVQQLSREATGVNQSFSQQVLQDGKPYDCGEPSPFQAEGKEQLASTAYRCAPMQTGKTLIYQFYLISLLPI